jgi:hypothetical protein
MRRLRTRRREIVTDTGRREVAPAETVFERPAAIPIQGNLAVREETTDEQSFDGHLAGSAVHAGDRDGRTERHDLESAPVAPPSHPRALPTLLEAIALWQGVQVHAALCAADRDGVSDSSLYRDAFADFGGPLYTLEWLPAAALDRRRRRDIGGVGDFADLRRLLTAEGTR